jgi:hypothetical protein
VFPSVEGSSSAGKAGTSGNIVSFVPDAPYQLAIKQILHQPNRHLIFTSSLVPSPFFKDKFHRTHLTAKTMVMRNSLITTNIV